MIAVQTWRLVAPSAMNSAASRQVADPADSRDRQAHVRIGGAGVHHVEGDRLDRRAAVAAVGALARHGGLGGEGVEVDVGDAVDRVDQRDRVGPGPLRRPGGDTRRW